jgi:predicted lipopolysaccharide heptosyltransferase III
VNILLLQLKRIGDLVLTTPAIAALREKYPTADISLIVAESSQTLLPAIPGIDHTFVAGGKFRNAADWITLARKRYDWCFDFTHSDRSAFLTMLSGAKKRVTFAHVRLQSAFRALAYNTLVDSSLRLLHTADYNLALLEPLDIRAAAQNVRLDLATSALEEARHLLHGNEIHGDFVLLHPGSARIEKFWKAERWRAIIDFTGDQRLACVMTGGASALEQTHIAAIKAAGTAGFVDLSGRIGLLTLAALINGARLLVTVDSAPMHLAAATRTPQVVLFGPTNPLHWRPRFSRALILQAGQSAPLTEFSPEQKRAPMDMISTDQVIDAMKSLLAAPRGASA